MPGQSSAWRPSMMSSDARDDLICELRRRGWTYRQIGLHVGLSERGASAALARIAEGRPGRPMRER
jgi:lambda repressor-like predicted transcriptional regulator